jgi:hypothetical protein
VEEKNKYKVKYIHLGETTLEKIVCFENEAQGCPKKTYTTARHRKK